MDRLTMKCFASLPLFRALSLMGVLAFPAMAEETTPATGVVPETQEPFPLEHIVPNMKGTTYTVLQGTKIVPVETIILGVEKNGLGPGLDMVIGKLVDPKTELTNAVHGMSGSPLYAVDPTDGKLKMVGALSRRIAFFEKDGHCGFTPIKDMLAVDKHVRQGMGKQTVSNSPAAAAKGLAGLKSKYRPMAVPLTISGGSAGLWEALAKEMGLPDDLFVVTPGGGQKPELALEAKDLVPGSPVAAVLMTGDVGIAGTGTLTWREGDRVLGFGHPMFGFGESGLPMATAEIITTIPSYAMPFKLSNTGKIVGTVSQDRWSAIGGLVGPKPTMYPYRIERMHDGESRPVIQGEFFPHEFLSPLLLSMAFSQSLMVNDDMSRTLEISIQGELTFANAPTLKLDNFIAAESGATFWASIQFMMPLMQLYNQNEEKLVATGLNLKIETTEKPIAYRIESILTDKKKYEPGETVKVYAEVRKEYGDRELKTFEFELPENLRRGRVDLALGNASTLDRSRLVRLMGQAKTVAERVNALNERRLDNQLLLQVSTPAAGLMLDDQEMPSLPASARMLLAGANTSDQPLTLNKQIWLEQTQPLDGQISGLQRLSIEIEP